MYSAAGNFRRYLPYTALLGKDPVRLFTGLRRRLHHVFKNVCIKSLQYPLAILWGIGAINIASPACVYTKDKFARYTVDIDLNDIKY